MSAGGETGSRGHLSVQFGGRHGSQESSPSGMWSGPRGSVPLPRAAGLSPELLRNNVGLGLDETLVRFSLRSSPFQHIASRRQTNATLVAAVISISLISNTTGSSDQEKNKSQVFRYASMPLDCTGGGTSNINISIE